MCELIVGRASTIDADTEVLNTMSKMMAYPKKIVI